MERIKICDFEMAAEDLQPDCIGGGTLSYLSSEIINSTGNKYIAYKSNDIWALGVIIFIIFTNCFPWETAHFNDKSYNLFIIKKLQFVLQFVCNFLLEKKPEYSLEYLLNYLFIFC